MKTIFKYTLGKVLIYSLLPVIFAGTQSCASDDKQLDPNAGYWKDSATVDVALTPQMISLPYGGTEKSVRVNTAIVGENILFRLTWKDDTKDVYYTTDSFPDGAAIMFPVSVDSMPSPFMGNQGSPVIILHWRADWQFREKAEEKLTRDYPADYVDWQLPYEAGFFEDMGRKPGKGEAAVYLSEGFGTLTAIETTESFLAEGIYDQDSKTYRVVFSVPLNSQKFGNMFENGQASFTIAVWDGSEEEVGGRKAVTYSWEKIEARRIR